MQVPLDITYRDVEKTDAIDTLIREKVDKLETVCDHIMSCHVAVERTHVRPDHGSPFRVRIDVRVPPQHELAVAKNPSEGVQYPPLETVIRDAFSAMERQLKELVERQQGHTKYHPEQVVGAIVTQLFPAEQYGFLKTPDGREIYFHQNSVLHNDFERLTLGAGVQFFASEGAEGLQASTVRLIDKSGVRSRRSQDDPIGTPKGW